MFSRSLEIAFKWMWDKDRIPFINPRKTSIEHVFVEISVRGSGFRPTDLWSTVTAINVNRWRWNWDVKLHEDSRMSWSRPAHQFSWAVLKAENFLLLVRKKMSYKRWERSKLKDSNLSGISRCTLLTLRSSLISPQVLSDNRKIKMVL